MGINSVFLDIIIITTVTLWKHVMSQCSEAHSMACSWPLVKLKTYDNILYPIGGFIPDYNETTLHQICSLFQEYKSCSEPFFSHCDQQTRTEFHILDSAFSPICNHLSSEYIKQRTCFRRLKQTYQKCQQQREEKLSMQKPDAIHYKSHMCTVTNDYVGCTYTVTALLCSIEAANVYFKIINESISQLLSTSGFSCTIRHPNDVIKVITTTMSTSTITSDIKKTYSTILKPSVIQQSKNQTNSGAVLNSILKDYIVLFLVTCAVFEYIFLYSWN